MAKNNCTHVIGKDPDGRTCIVGVSNRYFRRGLDGVFFLASSQIAPQGRPKCEIARFPLYLI